MSRRRAREVETPPYPLLEAALGTPVDHALLELAVTHRSYAYEAGGVPDNERLEFLGDAVLGLTVAEALYANHPDLPEGRLAPLRSSLVSARSLADVARRLELGRWLRLGRGEEATGGRDKSAILADALEAVLGAVYLSGGLEPAQRLVRGLFGDALDDASVSRAGLDWKTELQELTAARGLGAPAYALTDHGPDHAKTYRAAALVDGRELGTGTGQTKKEAEMSAARVAHGALTAGDATVPDALPDALPASAPGG